MNKATDGRLTLHIADTFSRRLRGLLFRPPLGPHEALVLVPCKAVHTCFLRHSIDVVFIDPSGGERRCIHRMPPWRAAAMSRAYMVIELPGGYCKRHPDYLLRIHAALRLRVYPALLP